MREQNSATTMNRREMLKLSAVATLVGTAAFPDKIQATQTVAMKPISLPELPPKASEDLAATLFPASCRLKFAPAERPSLFSTKATDHQCSFCMDIPRPT